MKTLRTEITIDAAPEEVWTALTDLSNYPEWNPFIAEAEGVVRQGSALRLRMTPPGGRPATLRPRITIVEPGRVFEWLGNVGPPGLFSGRHRFELHRAGTGTRLVQSETFRGALVPMLSRTLDRHTVAGLISMNDALKRRSEKASVVA